MKDFLREAFLMALLNGFPRVLVADVLYISGKIEGIETPGLIRGGAELKYSNFPLCCSGSFYSF